MYCTNCGKKIADGVKFCTNCGAAVNSQPAPAAEPSPPPTAQREVPTVERVEKPIGNMTESGGQPGKKKKGVPKKPLIIAVAALVLFVGFGAILNLFGRDSEPELGSKGSAVPDWVEKIPEIDVDLIAQGGLSGLSKDDMDKVSALAITYLDYKSEYEDGFILSGMPTDNQIKYFHFPEEGQMYGACDGKSVYFHNTLSGERTMESIRNYLKTEPLVAKIQISTGDIIYIMFYKANDGYLIYEASPSNPATSYWAWSPLLEIEVSDIEYCSFLNGEQELEIISIPGESNGDLGATTAGTDYSQYAGTWASSDVGWVYGGQILDIAVNGENMSLDFSEIQSAPASRVASVSQTIPVSEIQNGVVTVPFDNDDWGHSGTMKLTFTEEAIICEIKDVKESPEGLSQWGVMEGKFLLVRNSAAHEAMEYEFGDYEKMFPDSGQQSAESNWIENIPYLPGYADLYYFEDWGVRAHERSHDFETGGVEDFIGLSNSAQVSYSTSDIDGGTVCFGMGPEWTVSYAEVADEPLKGIGNYYQIIYEQEPLIGKRDDGYCFLFYKRDYNNGSGDSYCYEIYMVQQTDSPNYEDWLFRAYIYVNAPEFYDYLNGTKKLEIISIPGIR